MILKNNTAKGRVYTIIVNGYPIKVRVGAYGQHDLSKIDKRFETEGLDGVDISSRKNKKFGVVFNSHTFSLISNVEKGKSFVNFKPEDIAIETSGGVLVWDYEGIITVGTSGKGFGYSGEISRSFGLIDPSTYILSTINNFAACFWAPDNGGGIPYITSTGNIAKLQIGEIILSGGFYNEGVDTTTWLGIGYTNPFPLVGQTVEVKYILN